MARLTWHKELCLHSSVSVMAGEDTPPPSKGSVVGIIRSIAGYGILRGQMKESENSAWNE